MALVQSALRSSSNWFSVMYCMLPFVVNLINRCVLFPSGHRNSPPRFDQMRVRPKLSMIRPIGTNL
eukprot:3557549-Amphidinium_carterae.1